MEETAVMLDYKRIDFNLLKVESINNIRFNNEINNKVSKYQFKNMELLLRELFYGLDNGNKNIDVDKLKDKTKISENNVTKYLTKLIEFDCLEVVVVVKEEKTNEEKIGEKEIEE